LALAAFVLLGWPQPPSVAAPPAESQLLDPKAWGSDHVGQPIPQYMESGECLFCHRIGVGITWQGNKHNRAIREPEVDEPALTALRADPATKPLAEQVQLIMGDTRAQRFLKRAEAYGHLDLLSTGATMVKGRRPRLDNSEKPHWDGATFAESCAGCHATAVDPETHAFSAISLDCYACHGDSPAEHANDTTMMPLAKARKDSAAVVTSICASCHVRFGKSRATGLPYPTNFVAGDNLFKDFEVDFSQADNPRLNPADRHVMENVRDVVLHGRETMTCLSCHDVHTGSSKRHRELANEQYCIHCHDAAVPIKGHKTYDVHNERCRY
jgi:predicted CXXCH cytochrome family protein